MADVTKQINGYCWVHSGDCSRVCSEAKLEEIMEVVDIEDALNQITVGLPEENWLDVTGEAHG